MKQLSGRAGYPSKIFWKDTVDEKANLFNLFFKSVHKKTDNAMFQRYCGNSDIFLRNCYGNNKNLLGIEKDATGILCDCDDVPPFVWSSRAEFLAAPAHQFFSHILETCEWTVFWKCAFITPIQKKESKSNVKNNRPIIILPRLSLLFERIVFDFLYSKLRYKINSMQHGFRSGHSTITQLLVYLDELYANFVNNIDQVVVYIDFSNAFDSVNFNILLTKF